MQKKMSIFSFQDFHGRAVAEPRERQGQLQGRWSNEITVEPCAGESGGKIQNGILN
jgi:hypothetical protein